MPLTIVGLLIFVALFVPGLHYLKKIESRQPERQYSPVREMASVATFSLFFDGIVLAIFGLIRFVLPNWTLDIGELVRDPQPYFNENYLQVVLWGVSLLIAAVGLASLSAVPPRRVLAILDGLPWSWSASFSHLARRRRGSPILAESAWGSAFRRCPDSKRVHLGLRLVDGTYVYGPLGEFNPQLRESDDRTLQLLHPIEIRTLRAKETVPMDGSVLIVSAGQIKTMTVHYLDIEEMCVAS